MPLARYTVHPFRDELRPRNPTPPWSCRTHPASLLPRLMLGQEVIYPRSSRTVIITCHQGAPDRDPMPLGAPGHMPSRTTHAMKAVDLFAGAGGFSLGLRRAGFDVVLANEFSTEPEWTYRANLLSGPEAAFPSRPEAATTRARKAYRAEVRRQLRREREALLDDFQKHMRGGDIREVMPTRWLKEWRARHGEIDLVVAGPPCQGFSSAGARDPEDARNALASEAIRVVRQLQPKIVIIENVPGMLQRHADRVRQIGTELSRRRRGSGPAYKVVAELLHGERLGIPQTRQRLLVVGVREDLIAPDTHGKLGSLVFPTACPLSRFEVDEEVVFADASRSLSASAILDDLAGGPPPYGRMDSPWFCGYREPFPSNDFRREMRIPRGAYLGGLVAGANWHLHYANHDASVHAHHVAKRMRLLRQAAGSTQEGRESRCSSGWLKAQFLDSYPELRTNKASQRVLLADEWPMLTVTSLPDDIVHHREDRIPTVREVARLQTFPDWFEFKGVRTTGAERRRAGIYVPHYTQVANAVPPRLSHAVAARIAWFLQRVVHQGLRDCDFQLPGGLYDSPNTGTASAALAALNECFSECAARRERRSPQAAMKRRAA